MKGNITSLFFENSECWLNIIFFPLDNWALRFVPRENGIHLVHIRLDGIHIPESPLPVRIGADDADPAAVQAYGPGLKESTTGRYF